MNSARLFLALLPDEGSRHALSDWSRRQGWPVGTQSHLPRDLHLTLQFIGEVPRARVGGIADALGVPAGRVALQLDKLAWWRPAGIAVLMPEVVPQVLLDLHDALGDKLRAVGLTTGTSYVPHVTLARNASMGSAADAPVMPSLSWRSEGYALMESAGGYHVVRHYASAGR